MNAGSTASASETWGTLLAPASWHAVDVVSDLHLSSTEPATAALFLDYLQTAAFDALFILGDLFEVWVGDDVLEGRDSNPDHTFARSVCAGLRACATKRPVYVMRGNRDFLLGPTFAAHTGTVLLTDPTVLDWNGHRWLLSHGDAWCLDDHDYMRFRHDVRTETWQQHFLTRPLAEREAVGRQLRQQSEARKALSQQDPRITYADVDSPTACRWLDRCGAKILVHGHTHRPAEHDLGQGRRRVVLSDWDVLAIPPRAQAMRLRADGHWDRLDVRPTGV